MIISSENENLGISHGPIYGISPSFVAAMRGKAFHLRTSILRPVRNNPGDGPDFSIQNEVGPEEGIGVQWVLPPVPDNTCLRRFSPSSMSIGAPCGSAC